MVKDFITIIDFGSGNIRSATKAFEKVIAEESLNLDIKVSSNPEDVLAASRIVLPGQGAYGDCMDSLSAIPGMIEALSESVIQKAKPYFGICVGMQLLTDKGFEKGEHAGLGWISGIVEPLEPEDKTLKIPHMGWNTLELPDSKHFVLRSTDSLDHFYFVHSFQCKIEDKHNVLASADYGGVFPAIIGRNNIIGVQFHPEKSQKNGLELIKNFLYWKP